ncbi:MAG: HEAT repeat domain-containing protein [Planctomycetes bacterium]|nr:HEAT repeat domain-containing protein [Planctomycetota bacterium]
MRISRLASFLALPVLVSAPAAWAQADADPLKAPFSGSFTGTRLNLVIKAIHEGTKLNLVLDPSVDGDAVTVTASATQTPVGTFLAEVERQASLARSAWCGAVVLHPAGKGPGAEPRLPSDAALDARMTMDFAGTPLLFALERLRARTSLTIDVTARARADAQARVASVNLRVNRMQLKHLLSHLAYLSGLEWRMDGGRAVFDAPGAAGRSVDARPVELQGEGLAPRVDVAKLLSELRSPATRDGAKRQLGAAGKSVAAPVAGVLADLDPPTAIAALQVLQHVGGPAQAGPVLALFRDQERPLDVRTEAALTLGALRAPAAIPALIDALNDDWFRIAETARVALVQMGDAAVAPLAARYEQAVAQSRGNDGVAYRSLLVFGSIGTERCKQLLLGALRTTQGPRAVALRHHAAIGLGFTQDPKMIEPLIEALEREREFRVSTYIARSLAWITDVDHGPQPARWRSWWTANRGRILEPQDDLYDPLELPPIEMNPGGKR